MTPAGWIKIDRNIQSHWLWQNARHFQWWCDLLMMAQYKDTEMQLGARTVTVRRGQLIASVRGLCSRWSYTGNNRKKCTPSTKTVLSFLRALEQDGMIVRETVLETQKETLITICNYSKYQAVDYPVSNLPENDKENSKGNIIKEIKEIVDEVNGARVCACEGPPVPAVCNAPGQNAEFFARFFDNSRLASLEAHTKNLHTINPQIESVADFRNLARACLDEWELRDEPLKTNFREWAMHLIRAAEKKARAWRENQNTKTDGCTNQTSRPPTFSEARARGDDEFARFASGKLAGL